MKAAQGEKTSAILLPGDQTPLGNILLFPCFPQHRLAIKACLGARSLKTILSENIFYNKKNTIKVLAFLYLLW